MRISLLIMFMLLTICTQAQIFGNEKIVSKNYDISSIYRLEVNLYADVEVDMAKEAKLTMDAESNIIDFIGIDNKNGVLIINQKKWIEPNKRIVIKIGAPGLREVMIDTHDEVIVKNIDANIFKVEAPIGKVVLQGKVEDIRLNIDGGTVDATKCLAKVGSVDLSGDGKAMVNVVGKVKCNIDSKGKYININSEGKSTGCEKGHKNMNMAKVDTRYIDIKIKNNSWGRKHFVVVGPKPNGNQFSYGFSLLPAATKDERWTVGTKVYKESRAGVRTLLVELTEDDEGQLVKLF